jgi:hypothetical protein
MLTTNVVPEVTIPELKQEETRNLNREDFCQNCEVWICIKNCRNCLFNALLGYKPHKINSWCDD